MPSENLSTQELEVYRLRDLIASHIACEEDCQKMPTGCGCALTAARSVMNGVAQGAQLRAAAIEECAKVADDFAAYEKTVVDRAHADEALSDTGRKSVVAAAGSRQVAAEQLAHDIRALAAQPPAAPPAQAEQEPVGWLHTLHMDLGQTERRFTFTEPHPFGLPGEHYSAEYKITSAPVYAAQPPAAPVEMTCPGGIDPGFDECPKCGATDDEECRAPLQRLSAGNAAEDISWRRVNDEPFEYAIQQGPHGDEFVKLLNGTCLRRPITDTGPQASGVWQSIETAPKDGTRILLYQEGRGAFEGWWHTDWPRAEAYWVDDADSEPTPTYWQPTLALTRPQEK